MKKRIKGIDVCDIIKTALHLLESSGCRIIKSEVGDYHFNELLFIVKKSIDNDEVELLLSGLENLKGSDDLYSCKCHWHIIKLVDK